MKVTVDINVLLDVFQKREPHYAASARVMAMIEEGEIEAVFPAHGITTLTTWLANTATARMPKRHWKSAEALPDRKPQS